MTCRFSRVFVAGLAPLLLSLGACASSKSSDDTDVEDADVNAVRSGNTSRNSTGSGRSSSPDTLLTCANELTSCLSARPTNTSACVSDAEDCGLFSVSGALALTAAQVACAEELTACTLAKPTAYVACLVDAEGCGLFPKGTVSLAADGGIPLSPGVTIDGGIQLPLPAWDGSIPPLPGLTISDAGVITIPGLVTTDGGVGLALGPALECTNELFACVARDPSKANDCAIAAQNCLAAIKP